MIVGWRLDIVICRISHPTIDSFPFVWQDKEGNIAQICPYFFLLVFIVGNRKLNLVQKLETVHVASASYPPFLLTLLKWSCSSFVKKYQILEKALFIFGASKSYISDDAEKADGSRKVIGGTNSFFESFHSEGSYLRTFDKVLDKVVSLNRYIIKALTSL